MIELTLAALFSGFLLGFFGSAHCLGMCGGISASLGLAIPVGPSFRRRQFALVASYNAGRIGSYAVLGAVIAWPGAFLDMAHGQAGYVLRTGAGLLMIALGLSVGQWWQGVRHLERLGAPLWSRLAPFTRRLMPVTSAAKALSLGLAWGRRPAWPHGGWSAGGTWPGFANSQEGSSFCSVSGRSRLFSNSSLPAWSATGHINATDLVGLSTARMPMRIDYRLTISKRP